MSIIQLPRDFCLSQNIAKMRYFAKSHHKNTIQYFLIYTSTTPAIVRQLLYITLSNT